MTDKTLTFLEFENGDIVHCEHPDDALAKIRAMPKIEGVVKLTQQSLPSGFSQTLEGVVTLISMRLKMVC